MTSTAGHIQFCNDEGRYETINTHNQLFNVQMMKYFLFAPMHVTVHLYHKSKCSLVGADIRITTLKTEDIPEGRHRFCICGENPQHGNIHFNTLAIPLTEISLTAVIENLLGQK